MFISHAQNFEDVILWRALKEIQNGFYVDIGAHDPDLYSVSKGFYEIGWRGIHVEPVAEHAAHIRAARPDEIVVEAAISTRPSPISFFAVEHTGLSTARRELVHEYTASGFTTVERQVPCFPLSELFDRYVDRPVHWLKIDVEGLESEVIRSWLPSSIRPWIVAVESTVPMTQTPNHQEWEPELLSLGYDYVYFDGLNRYYVSHEKPELKTAFGPGPNIYDDFALTDSSVFSRHSLQEITALRQQVEEQEIEYDELYLAHDRIERDLQTEIASLKGQLDQHRLALINMQEAKTAAEGALASIHASLSWRLTAPARAAGRAALLARSAMSSVLSSVLSPNGGIARIFNNRSQPDNANPLPYNASEFAALSYDSDTPLGDGFRPVPLERGARTTYIFVDHTIKCPVNTGVQRAVRGLSGALIALGESVRFVKWDPDQKCCVLINISEREHLAAWNGPPVEPYDREIYLGEENSSVPIGLHKVEEHNWLISPEVTHLTYQKEAVTLDLILWARRCGLQIGFLFYDAIPLLREEFSNIASRHAAYMQHLRLVDVVWPISEWSAADLHSFWRASEHATARTTPEIMPLLLPGDSSLGPRMTANSASEKLILCVGTIEERKNQLTLIRAFKAYQSRNPNSDWRLILVGNLHAAVAKEVKASLNDNLIFMEGVTDEALHTLYRQCAFTVFPSVEEGFGLPILESLWFGKPCICANFGAMAEVADGGGCLTIDTRDEVALGNAIERMINDTGLIDRLTEEAAARPLTTWLDYGRLLQDRIDARCHPGKSIGPIYYWIDSTLTFPKNTGIQRVTRQLARALLELGLKLIPVKWNEQSQSFQSATEDDLQHLSKWNGPTPAQWARWQEPAQCGGGWFFMSELPLNLSSSQRIYLITSAKQAGLRTLNIFYDAIPWKMKDIYPLESSAAHKEYMRELARYDLVLPISEYSRADLVAFLGSELAKPQSLDRQVQTAVLPGEFSESQRVLHAEDHRGAPAVTVLVVGTVEPRKNHETLLRAFKFAKRRSKTSLRLVIAGGDYTFDPDLIARVQDVVSKDSTITWEKDADDARLRELYAEADFTVYPSKEEGFGLPILESLWHGKPCICAQFGAMAEAAKGGGCLTVDVRDFLALALAIETLANDPDQRAALAAAARLRKFKSWQDYAKEIAFLLTENTQLKQAWSFAKSRPVNEGNPIEMSLPRKPRLSICISTYNRAEWLAASLRNWERLYPAPIPGVELFVCDNASPDHTPQVVEKYLKRADFSYRRNPQNVGMLGNLRETANNAHGEYIWILGDDDLLMPGAIERVIKAIDDHENTSLIYLNYAYTLVQDARTVTDFDMFVKEAKPIVPAEPDKSGLIKDICARNENFFTAIYTLVFRRDHAINAYSQDTSGRPFSTMLTCIPTTYYVLNNMMEEPGVWIGEPQLVVNMNVSWMRYAPLWILERIPEVYEIAESKGVSTEDIDRWRRHTLPGAVQFFREIYSSDPMGNAAYFDPARLVRRFKHLPEFLDRQPELIEIYRNAYEAGHEAATLPAQLVFPNASIANSKSEQPSETRILAQRSIAKAYRRHLGRPADPEGRAFWLRQTTEGGMTIDEVVHAIAHSEEARIRSRV